MSLSAAGKAAVSNLGVGSTETLHKWVRQDRIDAGLRPGATTEELVELKRLRTKSPGLQQANQALKAAPAVFTAELDRPHLRS